MLIAGPGQRHPDHVALGIAAGGGSRPAPAWPSRTGTASRAGAAGRQEQRAERVDVLDRVEADPAEQARGVVAAALGHPAVRGLVQGDRDRPPAGPRPRARGRSSARSMRSGRPLERGLRACRADPRGEPRRPVRSNACGARAPASAAAARGRARAIERAGGGQHLRPSRRSGRCSGGRGRSPRRAPPRRARRASRDSAPMLRSSLSSAPVKAERAADHRPDDGRRQGRGPASGSSAG